MDSPIPYPVDGDADQPPTLPPSTGATPHCEPSNAFATYFFRAARPAPILAPRVGVVRLSRRVLLLFSGAYTRPDGLVAYLQRHDIEVVPVDNDPYSATRATIYSSTVFTPTCFVAPDDESS